MKTILIIEDNVPICCWIKIVLERQRHRVFTATNGQDGLEAARADPPDLILTDINMPIIDGYEVLSAVRAEPFLDRTKVVLMSGAPSALTKRSSNACRADGQLVKPFGHGELLECTNAVLAR